ncbi:kinectin-like [Macrobrachium nipponense]|uniref:kinectin-like n=1 Tax=Macrobrachium nipponense TaxID=159736 RepID=UPI0030C82B94
MFALLIVAFCALTVVACGLFNSIVEDLRTLYWAEGPLSVSQDIYLIAVDSVNPEIDDVQNFWTPGRAVAITCMGVALLAGLAVVAYRKYQREGKYVRGLEKDLESHRTEVARLRDRLETQEEGHAKTEEHLDKMTRDFQLLEHQRGRLEAEKKMLEEALEKSKFQESEMERLLEGATEQNEFLQNEIVEKDLLIERNAIERKEIESCLEEEKKAKDREIEILENELRSLFQKMVTKERELESALKEGTDLTLRIKEAEATNQVLASENKCFKTANDQLKEALEEKEKESDHLKNSKEASTQEIAVLRQKNADLQKQIENEEEKNKILNEEVQQMRNWVAELGGQNAKKEEELAKKELEVKSMKNSLEEAEEKNKILNEEVQQMRDWVAELGGQNAKMEEELANNEQKINSLKNSLQTEEEENKILNGEVQQMRNWVAELGGQIAKKEEELANKRKTGSKIEFEGNSLGKGSK